VRFTDETAPIAPNAIFVMWTKILLDEAQRGDSSQTLIKKLQQGGTGGKEKAPGLLSAAASHL